MGQQSLVVIAHLESRSRSRLAIPRMREEICTFLGIEGACNQADSATESFDCSLGGLAQLRFHFAEALFDRIEVRRILRQISQMRPHRFDCLAHADRQDFGRSSSWRAKHAFSLGHLDLTPSWFGLEPGRKFTAYPRLALVIP